MFNSNTRTIREFSYKTSIWPMVDSWAADSGFVLQQQENSRRLYRRGRWLMLGPTMVEISQEKEQVTLQSWIKADLYMLMAAITKKPPEVEIQSGGFTAWVPRIRARKTVNRLLARLGQASIV